MVACYFRDSGASVEVAAARLRTPARRLFCDRRLRTIRCLCAGHTVAGRIWQLRQVSSGIALRKLAIATSNGRIESIVYRFKKDDLWVEG